LANRFRPNYKLFVKPAEGWVSAVDSAKLTPSDGNPQDGFGSAVAIAGDGDEVFVGAPLNSLDLATLIPRGAAYVYDKPWDGWASTSEFQQILSAPEAVALGEFGGAIALGGKTLAVGAPLTGPSMVGTVYVFEERHDEH
jgi:FG-GAP repeat